MKRLLTLLFCTALIMNSIPTVFAAKKVAKPAPVVVVAPVIIPVEQKIVELHITRLVEIPDYPEASKKKKAIFNGSREVHYVCSGAFINDHGDILTAKHCTRDIDSIEVETFDKQHYAAIVSSVSVAHDMAVIHIDRSNTQHFVLAKEIKRGQKIHIIGSPLGIEDTYSEGVIAKIDGDHILLDCGVLPGNSGSTVFDDDGKLVGIATAGFIVGFGVTHLNIAQSLDAVRFFLKDLK
jgi:S1-C subfamily serine protease